MSATAYLARQGIGDSPDEGRHAAQVVQKPESIIAGKKVKSMANWLARNWLLTSVDTSSPMPKATRR